MEKIILLALGYCSGSILYGEIFVKLFSHKDLMQISDDGNPGTANAFTYGGFLCGVLTLYCDLLKGAIPVFIYHQIYREEDLWLTFMIAIPVIGHAFSVFRQFYGGKAIAVSFGVLIGLFPNWQALFLLIFCYLVSSFLRINPHSKRSIITYCFFAVIAAIVIRPWSIAIGICIMSVIVVEKHYIQVGRRERIKARKLHFGH